MYNDKIVTTVAWKSMDESGNIRVIINGVKQTVYIMDLFFQTLKITRKMGKPNDEDFTSSTKELTIEDLANDLDQINKPVDTTRNKFFNPSIPQFVLDEHDALLKLNPEYKKIVDEMEKDYPVFEEILIRMDNNTRRINEILEQHLDAIKEE